MFGKNINMSNKTELLNALAVRLFDIDAIKFEGIEAKIGVKTPMYFDLRVIVSYPDVLISVAGLLGEIMITSNLTCDSLCGVPYTALPIATVMSINRNIPMLMRRKETKSYGTRKQIEGHYKKGQNCIIIEDVVTSGGSIMETVRDLRREGIVVNDAIVVLDSEQDGASVLGSENIKLRSLYKLTELVRILVMSERISNETAKLIIHQTSHGNSDKDMVIH